MRPSLPFRDQAPEAYQNLVRQKRYLKECGLAPGLLALVEVRASQINGCAFCVDQHSREALEAQEAPRRLQALPVWREVPWFSPRERAALAWTEALTQLPAQRVTEALQAEVSALFPGKELVDLTHAIALINAWNRLGVAFLPPLPALEARP
ncbi:MAG: carboxymuconolactone decarboxylase family protein [Holophaga sp.]|nr:carboxymuconolactone decarboxylase family protein [Holophaga sp.]